MPTTQRKAAPPARAAHQPPATDAPAGAKAEAETGTGTETETQNGAGTPDRGDASQGSPAAPVMKQFARTDAESGDKR